MTSLTSTQIKVIEFIREKIERDGVSPTYREIAVQFGYKSPKAAFDHVRALEKKGYVKRRPRLSRGIGITSRPRVSIRRSIPLPILGHIPAGFPDAVTEYRVGTLDVDPEFVEGGKGNNLYVLRVKGDSMIGRGIYDGDLVVVDGDRLPKEKDIVVALVDGENTLKTLVKQKSRFVLRAENPNFPDLVPLDEMSTQGVVRAVLRRLK